MPREIDDKYLEFAPPIEKLHKRHKYKKLGMTSLLGAQAMTVTVASAILLTSGAAAIVEDQGGKIVPPVDPVTPDTPPIVELIAPELANEIAYYNGAGVNVEFDVVVNDAKSIDDAYVEFQDKQYPVSFDTNYHGVMRESIELDRGNYEADIYVKYTMEDEGVLHSKVNFDVVYYDYPYIESASASNAKGILEGFMMVDPKDATIDSVTMYIEGKEYPMVFDTDHWTIEENTQFENGIYLADFIVKYTMPNGETGSIPMATSIIVDYKAPTIKSVSGTYKSKVLTIKGTIKKNNAKITSAYIRVKHNGETEKHKVTVAKDGTFTWKSDKITLDDYENWEVVAEYSIYGLEGEVSKELKEKNIKIVYTKPKISSAYASWDYSTGEYLVVSGKIKVGDAKITKVQVECNYTFDGEKGSYKSKVTLKSDGSFKWSKECYDVVDRSDAQGWKLVVYYTLGGKSYTISQRLDVPW